MAIFPNSMSYAHQSFIGNVGGVANVWQPADAALTRPNNTTAYAAGEAIGSAAAVVFSFTKFFRASGSSGLLTGARLIASVSGVAAANMGTIRGHLFNALPTAALATATADQTQFNTLLADDGGKLGVIDFSTWDIGGSGSNLIESYGTLEQNQLPLMAAAASQSLYLVLVANGAFTPAAAMELLPYLSALLD